MALTQLPYEILQHIIEYVSGSDRAVLSRTCRELNEAIGWLPNCVKLDENFWRVMKSLQKSGCRVDKFIFDGADLQPEQSSEWDVFWSCMGTHVTCLQFRKCQLSERTFAGVICRCPRLTHLLLDECNSLLMSGKLLDTRCMDVPLAFRSLTCLHIINNRYLSDSLFNRFVAYTSCLTELSVAGCPISFHAAIFKRFYPANGSVLASESVLTFQNILKCIEKHAASIKCLDFSQTLIDDQALLSLSQVTNLSLHQLFLSNCHQLSYAGVHHIFRTQLQLRKINLQRSAKVCDTSLRSLTSVISHLNISECNKVSDEGLTFVSNLLALVELDVSACGGLSSDGLQQALCNSALRHMTWLNISACSLTEESIVAISRNLVHLRHLDLNNCSDGVTDDALQAIIRNLRWLRSLKLAWCKKLTDYGLTGCRTENDGDGDGLALNKLSGLVKLNLCGCSQISDVSLEVAIRFPDLTYLNLNCCERITDDGLRAVAARNRSLEKLKLSKCRNLTDAGIVAVVKNLSRLRHLDIQGCQKIGNESVEAMSQCCPGLRFLDVSICPGIASHALVALEKKLENLHLNQRQLRRSEFGGTLFQTSTFSKIRG